MIYGEIPPGFSIHKYRTTPALPLADAIARARASLDSVPPFKAGPIPASEYRDGAWRDAAFTVWKRPAPYPFKRQRVP